MTAKVNLNNKSAYDLEGTVRWVKAPVKIQRNDRSMQRLLFQLPLHSFLSYHFQTSPKKRANRLKAGDC